MLFLLRRISVENFRGVRQRQVLDFTNTPSGLYFVRGINYEDVRLGSNGSGKSTLLSESLIWALTGRTSRAQRPGVDVENRYANGTTFVELEFALDGEVHKVARTRRPNDLLLDGHKVEQQEVDDLLPLTDAALRKSVLIDQFGEMFLSLRPEAKSQIFTETLDLDRWIRASDNASIRLDKAARDLQTILRRQEANKAAQAEARDQYEIACKGEDEFEDNIKKLISDASARFKDAKVEAEAKREALDDARAKSAKIGNTDKAVKLEDNKTQLRRLQRTSAEALGQVTSTKRELARLEEQLARYNEAALLCPECGQPVGVKHIREKRTVLLGQIENNKQLLKRYDGGVVATNKEIEKIEAVIVLLEQGLVEFNKSLSEVAVCAERSIAADRAMHRIREELAELKQRENPFTKQCNSLEARVNELRQQAKAMKIEEDEVNIKIAIYQFWQKGFREIRLQQIDAALLELELATNRHAESLGLEDWRIAFATERETKKGTVSHGFTVSLYPPDQDEPVSWETYCGGEVQRWQLAATFGLSEVLLARAGISTDFEILDEPTKGLSAEGIEDLLERLAERARELNRKIFFIDHHSIDKGAFDGVILVAKNSKRGTYIEDSSVILSPVMKRERVLL